MKTKRAAILFLIAAAIFWVGAAIRNSYMTTISDDGTPPALNEVPTFDGTRWTYQAPPGASGGEANTASTLGNGYPLTYSKVGVDLRFNSVTNGTGITISSNANMLTFSTSAAIPPPAVVGNTIHVEEHGDDGTGTGSVDYPFRTLTAAFVAKVAGDEIVMGPGTFEFTVTAAASSTAEANRLVSNFAVRGAGKGVTTISVVPRGTNEHNRVLSVPNATPVTNVVFRGFTLDGNDSDYAWDTGGKLDWILQGQDITVEDVEVKDWGGNASLEAFNPLFQSTTNYVVRNSVFRLPGSVNVTGPTAQDSSRGLFEGNVVEGYNIAFGMVGMSSWNVITGNRMTNITTAGFIYDTAGSGEIWGNTISRNRFSSAGDGVLIGLGAHLDLRIFGNEFFGSNRGINLTNYNGSGTNYFLRPVVTENTFYISNGRNIYGTGVTNGAFFLNVGRSTSDNSVNGSANFGASNMDRTGTLYANIPNTLQGDGSAITAVNDDNVNFDDADSNFSATTIGAAIEELDDVNGSGPNAADGKVDWSQLVSVPAGFADGTDDGGGGSGTPTFVNGTEVTQGPDFDTTAGSGTVTPVTITATGTNVTVAVGNASATAAGAVTTGTQTFAGDKTFTGNAVFEGTVTVSGSGPSMFDSVTSTNNTTNAWATATRVLFSTTAGRTTDDADLTFATDTLDATKLTSTDVRAGLGVITNSLNLANTTASRAAVMDANKYVTNAPAAWTSVTLDTTNAVIDLAGSVPGVDRNYYYSLSTSNQIIFSNLVVGAQGTIWINAAATARQVAWSSSYDNYSTNDITWDGGTFTITNRAIVAYKVGWGTDATNVMLAIKRK